MLLMVIGETTETVNFHKALTNPNLRLPWFSSITHAHITNYNTSSVCVATKILCIRNFVFEERHGFAIPIEIIRSEHTQRF
jgi:hypothetical protein